MNDREQGYPHLGPEPSEERSMMRQNVMGALRDLIESRAPEFVIPGVYAKDVAPETTDAMRRVNIYIVRDDVICELADSHSVAGDCDEGFPGYVVRTVRSTMPHRYCLKHATYAAEMLLADVRMGRAH
jgi:hypothetical protein